MIKKFSFLISITNTFKHTLLVCLMALYSAFSYGTHAAGMDITYECVGGTGGSSGVEITVTINTDYYGNEITWTITNSSGVVVASGGPYTLGANTYIVTACVPIGTLNFNWYDSFGDGWNWVGIQGSYSVTQGSATLTSGSPSSGFSGSSTFYVSGGTPCTTSSSSQYLITVKFYRDCDGVSAPGSMTLNYSSASCGQSGNATLSQTSGGQEITPICPGYTTTCQNSFAIITGIQEYTYQATITLPAQCADWVLSVCECCRNNAITTINNPGGQELCVEAMINNSIGITPCNNSPTFSIPPVPFICNSMIYCYNNGATDIDGDSLVYTLVTPLSNNSGGTVSYNGGYSVNNPAGGTTMFDPLTGNLCLTTTSTLVTVIAIRVDEYRNGVLIGSVIRDVQVNVINCSNNTPVLSGFGGSPTNVNSNPASATYTFCADEVTPINLTIDGSDPNSSNNLNMTWNQSIPGATFNITGNNTNSPVGTFSWIPSSSNASSIPYYFTVSVTDDACPINASYSYSYSIVINGNPDAGISNNISVCETDPPFTLFAQLGGLPTGGGTWYDSNSNIATNNFNPSIQGSNVFTYVLDSAGSCPGDSATIIVTVNSAAPHSHIVAICYGDSIFLQNAWQTQAGIYLDTFLTATCDSIIQTTLSVNILPVVTPNFVVNGNTIIQPGPIYQLTQPLGNQAGSVWNSSLLDLNFPFDFEVELFFGCNNAGADGMAFVLQQVSSTIGSSGGGIGYLGISPSFGVEFDTWQNGNYGDPNHDHLAIQRNGSLNHNGIDNLFGPIGFPPGNMNIEDCSWHDVRFIWDPSINLFIVNFDGMQLVNYTIDIINTCFSGNPNVYWGFTAATGGANNLQQFRFKNYNLLDNTICRGDSIQINSLITNSSLSYLWLPNSGIDNNISSAPFFFPNMTTTYTLEVTNSYGCSFIDTFNIYVDTVDITGITNTSVSCNGGANAQAMILLGGNSSFYSYQWNDVNNQTSQIAYNLTAGNYNCIVTNDNYCTDTANVTIFEPPPISSVDIQIHCDSYTWIDGINYIVSNNSATYNQ